MQKKEKLQGKVWMLLVLLSACVILALQPNESKSITTSSIHIDLKNTYTWSSELWNALNKKGFSDLEAINIIYNTMAECRGMLVEEKGNSSMYRGRGYVQLTGKRNYEYFGKKLGIDLVNHPELANDPKYASQIAAEFYAENKKWRKIKDYNTPENVIKALAPANSNWSDRKAWLDKNNIRIPTLLDKPIKS